MPHMTLTPDYINPPKAGKKYASINCQKVYYSFDQDKIPLSTFRKGVAIICDVVENNGYQNIVGIIGTPQTSAGTGGSGQQQAAGSAGTNSGFQRNDASWTPEKIQGHRRLEIAKACIQANVSKEVGFTWLNWVNAADEPQE